MKIVIVGTAYPFRGAMAQMNATLGWHLSKVHDVEIVSFTRQYPKLLFPGKTQTDPSAPLFDVPTIPLIDSVNPLSWLKAAWYIVRRNPDLLIFRYWIPFLAPSLGTIARRVRAKTHAHIMAICDNILPHEHRPGDAALTRYALKAADSFIVQSRAVQADLLNLLPDARSTLVLLPIYNIFGKALSKEAARKKLGIGARKKVLLFFGYIRKYKGLHVLLDALSEVLHKENVTLYVVGEFYEAEQDYRNHISRRNLQDAVILRPEYIPNEEIAPYFCAADTVVLPYLSATQSAIVPIAYHFDKPVIATDVGGIAEVVIDGKTGILVPPNDPTALSHAILRFYKQRLESPFVNQVKVKKKRYSWNAYVDAIESMVHGIEPKKKRGRA